MTNIPKIRFKGFSKEWEESLLKNISKIYDGTHQTPKYTSEGVKFLSVENINTLDSNKFISEEDFIKDFKIYPEYNDILMTRIGSIGKTKVVKTNEKLAYYVSLALFKPNENINSDFLNYSINSNSVQNELWNRTLHVAFPLKINKNEIGDVPIYFPDSKEQEKIGNLFKNLDNLIENQEKILENSKAFKKSMLQKMFPRGGESIPEIRFSGFSGDWITVVLSDIGDIYTGNTPKTSIDDYWSDTKDVIWITPTDIKGPLTNDSERYLTDEGRKKARYVPKDSVLITSIASIGKNTINTEPACFNQQINAIVPKDSDSYFILQAMNNDVIRFKVLAGTSATSIINKTQFSNFNIKIPSLPEQQKIGNFFKNLDLKISRDEELLNNYKSLKKSLLQKMFV